MNYTTALVTGGAGFIGSHLVDALVKKGVQVTVVDDASTGNRVHVHSAATFHKMSVTSPAFSKLVETVKPEVIFHLAAQISVQKSVENPLKDAQVNVLGTLRLIEAAAKAKVKKIVFSSTGGALYGSSTLPPYAETAPVEPPSPYGIAKRASEMYLAFAQEVLGVPSVCLRYANVYGPRQSTAGASGVIAAFSKQLLAGKSPTIYGTGTQSRDFVYVGDVVEANLLAARKNIQGVLNIGTGRKTSVNELFALVKRATDSRAAAVHKPGKLGEVMHSCLDASKAKAMLGWEPKVTLEQGLARTVEWFRAEEA